ncbi:putative E3 ubiquitin-protein ligase HERC4 [Cryptotermes secundus]|uniref:Putative E3 ubiquitin-protein ligase HERC4 n=1 Tax=Cryptotermes secundus TaxID=105785 RepID=A0A2J7Q0N6_9NEOP|nr:probable E3 ubiquitin-protein ligase HERC4 isoform X2 [Cryptotermes secundus]PNF22147.1 putative E3 ubiquitin-protein ligase HERC4 [Cryptotermes secundus]
MQSSSLENLWWKDQNSSAEWMGDFPLQSESDMFCWGNTVNGELGLGGIEEEHILLPRELNFNKTTNIKEVACGSYHTVIVTRNGEVYTCGSNDHGQLGHEKPCKKPGKVDSLSQYLIIRASCGACHTLTISEWGQVFGWGSDSHGQLGNGLGDNGDIQLNPKMIKSLATSHVIQITCGQNHSLALTQSGTLYAWGCNSCGQLGIGNKNGQPKPSVVSSLAGIPIAFVACGGNHSFAVSRSGAVYGWGKNCFGQLGLSDDTDRLFPCQLKTLRSIKVKYIACGEDFSVFLTKDGGVFTCGAGMYGQLGHGSTSNEFLPRKVIELMGSVVTQISCGRRHALAFVPSRGRVYAFGLGGAGQLGTKAIRSATTPQVVLGPWVSPGGVSVVEAGIQSEHASKCMVKRIYSGGDHCFATVTHKEDNIPSDDFRDFSTSTQILSITEETVQQCEKASGSEMVDQDLMSCLETVFSSQACINCSFLLPNDEHYCCTSRRHGVDLPLAEQCFSAIGRVENSSIKELIANCVVENLLPSLVTSPPDVETLRLYLILPLYHEFDNPKNYTVLHNPFGRTFLTLKTEASKIVGLWWSSTSLDYFERLIRVFKNVVMYILRKTENVNQEIVNWDHDMEIPLEVLGKLNKLNNNVDGLKVPYDSFYLTELTEKVDVRLDYLRWLTTKDPQLKQRIYFCNYPFLFDAQTKTLLLQTNQSLQMQSAMNQAATRAISSLLFSPFASANISTFLELHVSRRNLVADTIRELAKFETADLKKPLKVKFENEEAEDAGGVTKEFFLLLSREILDPKYGMFRQYDETRTIWFSEDSFEDEIMYYLIGALCGLAIYNFTIIDLPFPLALYKKLLKEPVSLLDLRGLSPTLAKSLQDLLDYKEADLEEVFCLNFEITREVFGEIKVQPLKPGGGNIPVTQENKQEFVDLYVDLILNTSVEKHFKAFSTGFHEVCGGRVLELFHSQELMALVAGNENYDWEELQRNAEYKNGYTENDKTIRMFWEVFHELSEEEKRKFLLFLTGSVRIPIQGMKAIKIYIQPSSDDRYLPVAHTCFNLLDLPRYGTKEKLRYKLMQAMQQTEGFSLV